MFVRRFVRRLRVAPWIVGAGIGGALYVGPGWPIVFCVAGAAVAAILLMQLDALRVARQEDRIENQLADAIDLMVAAVKVGTSLPHALESVVRDCRPPLRAPLEEVVGRIRLGDDVVEVLAIFARRVPLETFRLFSTTLAVNWDTGGRLGQTLAAVGRTIRDRMELSRRMRSLTTQARASIVSVVAVTYFIAALMWRNDPPRMEGFLASTVGQWIAAIAIGLQAVGMFWISAMSKPKF